MFITGHLWIQKHRNKYKVGNIRASVISCRRVTATMAQVNLCAVLYGKRDLRMENQPIPQPGPNELQIRMLVVGICGSDVGMWEGAMSPGTTLPIMDPIVLGHEPCGVVCGLGFSVSGFAIGDKVTMNPNLSCRACRTCKSGRHNLCEKGIAMMTEHPTDGCLSNYIVWPADLCYRLTPGMTAVEGALVQPLACALHACQRAKVTPGDRVLICGAGPLGTMVVKAAGALGASHICVTDIKEERLQLLARHSLCASVHVQESFTNESIKHVTDALGGPADVTIECSGSPSAVRLAIHVTRPGGCVLLAGIGDNEVQIPLRLAATNEIDLKGILRYPPNRFTQALELISAGVIEVKPLVKHSFPLEKAREALEMAARRDGGKIVVECFKE